MDVIVVGAGPTGLTLAHELALGGAGVVVLEKLTQRIEQTKGGTIQPRTAELLDARGLIDAVLEQRIDRAAVGGHFGGLPVSLENAPWQTRYPHPIGIPQWRVEEILESAATARGARVLRDHDVTAIRQDDTGVTVTAGGTELRAQYVVACDGAHSVVRKLLDLPFPGRAGTHRAVLADVRLSAVSDLVPERAGHMSTLTRSTERYWGMVVPIGGDRYRFTYGKLDEPETPMSAAAVQQALTELYGEPTTLAEIVSMSHFSDATRQLENYRHGGVFFAGDAAHIHPPLGGQGLNLGVQDALNLGWKLAATLAGWAPPTLLDTYQAERHPKAARVLHHTAAQGVLAAPNPEPDVLALREIVTELLRLPDTNRYVAGMMSGLDDPLRLPDLDLVTATGPTRVAELLRAGRPVLLDLTGVLELPAGWDHVDLVHAKADADFAAALIRPDGAVAWRGETPPDLQASLGA